MTRVGWKALQSLVGLSCICVTLAVPARAVTDEQDDNLARPRVGLVLSGGGARGAAHVGVLQVLEEYRIPVDIIVATSMGAIVGGLYAAGMSPEELEETMQNTDWVAIFHDQPDRKHKYFRRKEDDVNLQVQYGIHFEGWKARLPLGVVQGQKLTNLLKYLALRDQGVDDFDDLPVPFRAVASDLATGEAVVLSSGDLGTAMRASMSVPGIIRPQVIDGRQLVDGGISANLPVQIAKDLGAEVVIAVDISTPLDPNVDPTSVLAVIRHLMDFLTVRNVEREKALLEPQDLLIEPDLEDISSSDFEKVMDAISIGVSATEGSRDKLRKLTVSEETFEAWVRQQRRPQPENPIIDRVAVENQSPVSDGVILSQIRQREGQPFEPRQLQQDLSELYGMEYFDPLTFELKSFGDHADLVIEARRRRTGLGEVHIGLVVEEDFSGGGLFGLLFRHDRLAMNRKAGEWRNELGLGDEPLFRTEFYQPLDKRLRYFVAPSLFFERYQLFVAGEEQPIAKFAVNDYGFRVDVGRNLRRWGDLRLGLAVGHRDPDIEIGPDVRIDGHNITRANLTLRVDTLDDPMWPTLGTLGFVELAQASEALGGETETSNFILRLNRPVTFGRSTFVPGVELGLAFDDDDPAASEDFELGGAFRLSGLKPAELVGNEAVLARLVFYYRLNKKEMLRKAGWYVGFSAEAGNTYFAGEPISIDSLLGSGSVFFGAGTPLGPILLGYGYTEGGQDRFFLLIGRNFLSSRRRSLGSF